MTDYRTDAEKWADTAHELLNSTDVEAMNLAKELHGTSECPICGHDKPHSHDGLEVADRPFIDGARKAFEANTLAREVMHSDCFKGIRTGYWWGIEGKDARGEQKDTGGIHNWAHRNYPWGPYSNEFTETMWQFWRCAWIAAKRQAADRPAAPAPSGKE